MSSITCSNCGRVNRPGAKMCANCGKPLGAATPIPPPPMPQPKPPPPPAPRQPVPAAKTPSAPRAPGGRRVSLSPRQYAILGALLLAVCFCLFFAIVLRNVFEASTPTPTRVTQMQPTPLITVVSPTPLPPTATSAPPPATSLPPPTSTPAPTATHTPTVTPIPDAVPGTTLAPEGVWRQKNIVMTLQNPNFSANCKGLFEFNVVIQNAEPRQVFVDLRGTNLSVTDDQGKTYDNLKEVFYQIMLPGTRADQCEKYAPLVNLRQNALNPNEKITISVRVTVPSDLDPNVKQFFFTAAKVGDRIENARWSIPVPR